MWSTDSLEKTWCWVRLRSSGKDGIRGWDGWMASLTQWTCAWAVSGRLWEWSTGKYSEVYLQFMGSQKVTINLATQPQQYCREPAREIPPMTRSCGEAWWARRVRLQGFPLGFPEHLPPKTRVCLPYCTVLSSLLPLKGINLGLQSTVSCI